LANASSNSASSLREIFAVFRKEALGEFRSQTGLMTAGLFGLVAVFSLAFAAYGIKLSGTLSAGLLWVGLMFAATLTLPRAMLQEEEAGTADLLRQWSRPHPVYWGKIAFNSLLMSVEGLMLTLLFVVLTEQEPTSWPLLLCATVTGGIAIAAAVTLCGVVVARAANRTALAAAIGAPLLLPLASLGIGAMRGAFGDGLIAQGWQLTGALVGYAATLLAIGPYLYAAVWKS
jgi:heme exporter protein B